MSGHVVGYSRSSKAKCYGPEPCKGSFIPQNTLRYGRTTTNDYGGTSCQWRHWGCVTPAILSQLATVTMASVQGFDQLSAADQNKIRTAISRRRVDPADIPPTAGVVAPVNAIPSATPSQKRRREEFEAANRQASSSAAKTVSGEVLEGEAEEVEPDEPVDELYVTMKATVVGVQYYRGMVGPGEEVRLLREPTNQYDRNAIRVDNIGLAQVGHIPRNISAKLAPLLDQRLVTVEGIMIQGNLSPTGSKVYQLDINLKIYGSPFKRQELEPKLIWATPGQRGFGSRNQASSSKAAAAAAAAPASYSSYGAPQYPPRPGPSSQRPDPAQLEAARKRQEEAQKALDLQQMLVTLQTTSVDDEERRNSLLDQLLPTEDILKLPVSTKPPGIGNGLLVDLLRHQSQALQWAIERENPVLPKKESDKPVQFWQLKKHGAKTYYYNLATKTPQEQAPVLGRGALCADAMGLGKTLTMLALIIATKADVPQDFSNSTLIVAPLSILSNWEKQIKDHCAPGSLSYYTYYGPKRDIEAADLQKYDVVITTYQVVAGEHDEKDPAGPSKKKKKAQSTLFDVRWKRAVLDEAHMIRNSKTKMAKAAYALTAQRRWALAATPIINSPKDLGSLITFLQICHPLPNEDFFKRLLLRPLKDGDPAGAALLRNLMSHICLRRTKEMQDADGNPLVPLPPVEMIKVQVALSDEARVLYDEAEGLSKNQVQAYMRSNNTMARANILSLLTRLRQLALHTNLVGASYIEELRANSDGGNAQADGPVQTMVVTQEDKLRLQAKLAQAIEECEECPICFNLYEDPRITSCAHIFCLACITEVVSRDKKCPLDRRELSLGDLHVPLPPMEATQVPFRDQQASGSDNGSSAKIDQLVQLLALNPSKDKSLVFSQFTSFLDKIAERFEEEGIEYLRFDGRMSAKRREETIAQFSIPVGGDEEAAVGGRRRRSSGDDSDFVMEPDNDDFIDDTEDTSVYSQKKRKKGKGKQKAKVTPYTSSGRNPKVMLISLKAGALGLNLTVANNVYLMDPWWQEGIESQAIDRVNRIGQKKPVTVYQLIAENTVESKVLEIQDRKKKLIQEAFSGIKRTETQRQQKEARLQDLIELFGLKQQN